MTTPGSEPRRLAEALARVVRLLAEATELAAETWLQQEHVGSQDDLIDPGVVLEVSSVQSRPGRAGDPHRIALWCLQRGPLPATPVQFWVTLRPEENQPYEAGQQYDLLLKRRA